MWYIVSTFSCCIKRKNCRSTIFGSQGVTVICKHTYDDLCLSWIVDLINKVNCFCFPIIVFMVYYFHSMLWAIFRALRASCNFLVFWRLWLADDHVFWMEETRNACAIFMGENLLENIGLEKGGGGRVEMGNRGKISRLFAIRVSKNSELKWRG